jgi:O-acetyl-ADP-ribose deacetylase (regulator of RNase III)
MPIQFIKGDVLEANVDYIVQQNCCTSIQAQGLSKAIATKWPSINPYQTRKPYKYNWAIAEDRPIPGSIRVYEFEDHHHHTKPSKGVICAFAQVSHGKPGALKDPLGLVTNDSAPDRQAYFKQCLNEILKLNPTSIGFPYKIGCGLAGGSWSAYEKILRAWSAQHPSITINIYEL